MLAWPSGTGRITAYFPLRYKHDVRLLANLLPFVEPGWALRGKMPHNTFRVYRPLASAHSFAPQGGYRTQLGRLNASRVPDPARLG